jgi:CheY-like chemotaxis protein
VLVVDDDPDSRRLTGTMLERAGANVLLAGSAAEARRALAEAPFDALVADIAMPGEDGLDLVRDVRATPDGRDLPAIALSAYARPQDRERALEAGYDAHLTKPAEPDALAETVASVVRRTREA